MTKIVVQTGAVGSYVGAGGVHPAVMDAVRDAMSTARRAGAVADAFTIRCGDHVVVVTLDPTDDAVDGAFRAAADGARSLGQHGEMGPMDRAELDLDEPRGSEPVVCILTDKAAPGSLNVHTYRAFADPFNTKRLLTEPLLAEGFTFEVGDEHGGVEEHFDLPDHLHAFLRAVAEPTRAVRRVVSRATGTTAAVVGAGPDPVMILRCEDAFPTVGEVLEPFAFPYAVGGWMGASGPLFPMAWHNDASSRSDGPPRTLGLGFQVTEHRLVGPRDLFGDPAFDEARRQAAVAADYLRRHGPFAPNGSAFKVS